MKNDSLYIFNEMIESEYPRIKDYIISSKGKKVTLEYFTNSAWGANKDLEPLFEWPCKFPLNSFNVKYSEKDSIFSITLNLK